ncbi:hypothetical protein [Nocardia mexicana]|uniref:Uncharacterized protein n=1 Tax=Nocardia mexicana TaxID=279262 RepID=A0A370HAR8_9NOCA|nr:hypothetical protein [Nocardia mexicana]RDI54029.1 hypothetical protein DFR68_102151 [Nocardia mexicana]
MESGFGLIGASLVVFLVAGAPLLLMAGIPRLLAYLRGERPEMPWRRRRPRAGD